MDRVASPINDEVGGVSDLTERACGFPCVLNAKYCGAVTRRCGVVDETTDKFGEFDSFRYRLARSLAPSIEQRILRILQDPRRPIYSSRKRCRAKIFSSPDEGFQQSALVGRCESAY